MEKKKKEVAVVDGGPPYLPREIIISILKRLPVKTLLRFRCVCKDWNILLKTPSFITLHLTHHAHHNDFLLPPTFLIFGTLHLVNHDLQLIQIHHVPFSTDTRLVGSCNGLLCLQSFDYKSLTLWNPATRDILHLPPHPTQDNPKNTNSTRCLFGFGFSASVNDYKIVSLYYYYYDLSYDGKFLSVQEFSLSTGSWKELAEAATTLLAMNLTPHVRTSFTFDGEIFWYASKLKQDDPRTKEHCLISFDIATESFTLIPIPEHFDEFSHLTTHENKLAMLTGGKIQPNGEMPTAESYSIDLWVVEKSEDESEDGWIWTKLYTINPYPYCPHILMPRALWRNQFL